MSTFFSWAVPVLILTAVLAAAFHEVVSSVALGVRNWWRRQR